jgi:hypothetical protein
VHPCSALHGGGLFKILFQDMMRPPLLYPFFPGSRRSPRHKGQALELLAWPAAELVDMPSRGESDRITHHFIRRRCRSRFSVRYNENVKSRRAVIFCLGAGSSLIFAGAFALWTQYYRASQAISFSWISVLAVHDSEFSVSNGKVYFGGIAFPSATPSTLLIAISKDGVLPYAMNRPGFAGGSNS